MHRDPTEEVRRPRPERPPDRVERWTRLLIAAAVVLVAFALVLVIASAANLRRDLVAPATSSPTASALAEPSRSAAPLATRPPAATAAPSRTPAPTASAAPTKAPTTPPPTRSP